jgi:histidinol-phosphate aminotransferase
MSPIAALLRPDLRDFAGYSSARAVNWRGEVWLNANEAPLPSAIDPEDALRRYPAPQPIALREALAALYGVAAECVLLGRGSDEAIDLLVRALCRPERDAVLITPPVFGMYAVCARVHGARLIEVPLIEGDTDFFVDYDSLATRALAEGAKLVFLCAPGNPAGGVPAAAWVLDLARRLAGHALVVVDEAYIEFADVPSIARHLGTVRNLAVLRTLSKAHALAGLRIGCLLADAELVNLLRRCQAPYPIPAPCAAMALSALTEPALAATRARIDLVRRERARLASALAALPAVRRVYPPQGNFLLARFVDAETAFAALLAAGIVVREQRALPSLADALRIAIGTPAENARVLEVLRALEVAR